MENITEAVGMFDRDCYFEECGVITEQAIKEFSLSADFAAGSAKVFIAAWRDGKWVPTGGSSSRRKKSVGGKRW